VKGYLVQLDKPRPGDCFSVDPLNKFAMDVCLVPLTTAENSNFQACACPSRGATLIYILIDGQSATRSLRLRRPYCRYRLSASSRPRSSLVRVEETGARGSWPNMRIAKLTTEGREIGSIALE